MKKKRNDNSGLVSHIFRILFGFACSPWVGMYIAQSLPCRTNRSAFPFDSSFCQLSTYPNTWFVTRKSSMETMRETVWPSLRTNQNRILQFQLLIQTSILKSSMSGLLSLDLKISFFICLFIYSFLPLRSRGCRIKDPTSKTRSACHKTCNP